MIELAGCQLVGGSDAGYPEDDGLALIGVREALVGEDSGSFGDGVSDCWLLRLWMFRRFAAVDRRTVRVLIALLGYVEGPHQAVLQCGRSGLVCALVAVVSRFADPLDGFGLFRFVGVLEDELELDGGGQSNGASTGLELNRFALRTVDPAFIERRLVGGNHGGSGQFVYSLGRRGFYTFYTGRFNPIRSVRYHTLAIVDCVVILRRLERSGLLTIAGLSWEPDCWTTIAGQELMPDLYVELVRQNGQRIHAFIEVDMATENQRQVTAKLERYYRAWDDAKMEVFPLTLWVVVDDERATELTWLIGRLRDDASTLFKVTTIERLGSLFGG